MPLAPLRVLIINRQLDFGVTVKKSLEEIGGFEVSAFKTADTALDYAATRPHDVALVDFTLRGISGHEIIAQLRALQPHIAIIATPQNTETHAARQALDLQNVIDTPLGVRQLMPIIQRAVQSARQTLLSDTAEAPLPSSLPESAPTSTPAQPPAFTPLDAILEAVENVENHTETIEVDMSDLSLTPSQEIISIFEQLAAEEPPLPGIQENATLRDLRDGLLDTGVQGVVQLLAEQPPTLAAPQPLPADDGESPEEPIIARKILADMRDHTSRLKPLIEAVAPEAASLSLADALDADRAAAITPAAPTDAPESELDDAALAQIALDLTQASLELTAEASLLTQHNRLIASAGKLPQADINALYEAVQDDLQNIKHNSRIHFCNLKSSGKDYMLYSRRTEGDFILTMAFAGNMPLHVIRRQSDKLHAALSGEAQAEATIEIEEEAIAEAEAAPSESLSPAPPPKPLATMPFTYVWMIQDIELTLTDAVAQAIVAGLDMALTQKGWMIHTLRVAEDYIYLYAQVPTDLDVSEVIQALKRESATIAATKDKRLSVATLWADAYFALMPGRELDTEEIQRFIRFGRM